MMAKIGDKFKVDVTAYSSESPETGTITASGQTVRRGIIAVSRDLENIHGLRFGDHVKIGEIGIFEIQDRMNKRWTMRVDIWMPTVKEAMSFGIKTLDMVVVELHKAKG